MGCRSYVLFEMDAITFLPRGKRSPALYFIHTTKRKTRKVKFISSLITQHVHRNVHGSFNQLHFFKAFAPKNNEKKKKQKGG